MLTTIGGPTVCYNLLSWPDSTDRRPPFLDGGGETARNINADSPELWMGSEKPTNCAGRLPRFWKDVERLIVGRWS